MNGLGIAFLLVLDDYQKVNRYGVWDGANDDALALQLEGMENSLGTMSLSNPHRTTTRPEKKLSMDQVLLRLQFRTTLILII
ncbi:unnamed protein product [Linum tenue]|uniref:Uncharacterized protein n=1 Tax=Linum tenue TaxID=586396 RepID=A0AAV0MX18_9ROSI|nr:unnamed protein product [Linum tenue]CAI0450768.1 unnamed protein product [Linum tenue]